MQHSLQEENKLQGTRLKYSCFGLQMQINFQTSTLTMWRLYLQKLALTSPTSGGRSVGIVRSQTQATEFVLFLFVVGHL
jgi:hypothetical protein